MRRLLAIALFMYLPAAAVRSDDGLAAVLEWSQRVVLSSPVSGVIRQVSVRPGDTVAAGQSLVQFDQRLFDAAVTDAKAQLHKHELQRNEARRELERTRELYERTVIASHDLQLQEIAFAAAESDYTSAAAALDTARLQKEYSNVQAPFAGVVLAVPVSVGMTVVNTQQATPLVTLAQFHPMHARVLLPGAVPERMVRGTKAVVYVNDRQFPAELVAAGAEPDTEGHYSVVYSFDPGDYPVLAGQDARVETN
jgi:multidrug efflux system membrane fusion protein